MALSGAARRGAPRSRSRRARQAPDLVQRDFSATRPDALWLADFTHQRCWEERSPGRRRFGGCRPRLWGWPTVAGARPGGYGKFRVTSQADCESCSPGPPSAKSERPSPPRPGHARHNPRVGGSSPSSGTTQTPANHMFRGVVIRHISFRNRPIDPEMIPSQMTRAEPSGTLVRDRPTPTRA